MVGVGMTLRLPVQEDGANIWGTSPAAVLERPQRKACSMNVKRASVLQFGGLNASSDEMRNRGCVSRK
jgi:hypothetical protein